MLIIDNINKTVKEDLQAGIQKGSKMSVAAACFSIYAYQELKRQLEGIEELRFIFTSPYHTDCALWKYEGYRTPVALWRLSQ